MDVQALKTEARSAIAGASTLEELDAARVRYLGRKSELKQALREVRDAETGSVLNTVREELESAVVERQSELERVELDRRLTQEVVDGREVETTHYNFDGLNFPPGHPARSPLQTLFLDDETVLRTETSPSQVRTMEAQQPPIYIVSLGRVYRRDTPDATHTPIFHQIEGLAVDRGITMADLKGTLLHMMRALFGEEREMRFRTHFFPFTEPSVEALVSCHICDGSGCPVCRHSGWIEVGGSGMVDPNLFEFVGYDPERYTGFAFGWGLERIAVLRHGIPDLRELWRNDPRLLRQF